MSETKLLPCPFCGGEAEVETGSVFMWEHIIVCKNCGASSKMMNGIAPSQAREKAINAWNTRKPVERLLERLEEEIKEVANESWTDYEERVIVGSTLYGAIDIIKEEVQRD